jgi:hypothetical protein
VHTNTAAASKSTRRALISKNSPYLRKSISTKQRDSHTQMMIQESSDFSNNQQLRFVEYVRLSGATLSIYKLQEEFERAGKELTQYLDEPMKIVGLSSPSPKRHLT